MEAPYQPALGPSRLRLRAVAPDPPLSEQIGQPESELPAVFFALSRRVLLEDASDVAQSARATRARLEEWGLGRTALSKLPIGWIDSPDSMRDRLAQAGFPLEEIRRSRLVADRRLAGRLVGPITMPGGRIVSFWARALERGGPAYLYWRARWKKHTPAVGLDAALGLHPPQGDLLLVEDILEALLLQSLGFRHAAALGEPGESIASARWERLADCGARGVTLALDRDRNAAARLAEACEALFRCDAPVRLFVLPPEGLWEFATPGELVRASGIEALRSLLEDDRLHAYTVKARAILDAHRPKRGWSEAARRKAMREAAAFYSAQEPLGGDRAQDLDGYFIAPIVEELGWPWGALEPTAPVRRPPTRHCALHDCDETDCFCFD